MIDKRWVVYGSNYDGFVVHGVFSTYEKCCAFLENSNKVSRNDVLITPIDYVLFLALKKFYDEGS